MKLFAFLLIISGALGAEAATYTFLPKTAAKSVVWNANDPVCIYLDHGYRPVTQVAVKAVAAAGKKTCSDKAEIQLYKQTGKTFIKHNKSTLGEAKYNEIKKAYYKFMSQQ